MYQICEFCGAVDYFDFDEKGEVFCLVCGEFVDIACFVEELDE